ncbi:DUF1826 domain-containing protein [Pseudoroseomonas globiformis]|uniref:DUF1826 domain-containing protein n=1 Tax=Teichococcus globiformis TaxID=2307229 RepID=A0ABV7FX04_9PROT
MTLVSEALTSADPQALRMVAAAEPIILASILSPTVSLAIWGRELPRPLLRDACRVAQAAPFVRVGQGKPDVAVARAIDGFDPLPHPALMADMLFLAKLFAEVSASLYVRLRLEAVADSSCSLFHADAVRLRLLCTYCGDGTEWLARAGGGAEARRLRDGSALPDPSSVQRLPTGAAAILRGEARTPGCGCIHRSPPMPRDATGRALRPRLLLCIDPAEEE